MVAFVVVGVVRLRMMTGLSLGNVVMVIVSGFPGVVVVVEEKMESHTL